MLSNKAGKVDLLIFCVVFFFIKENNFQAGKSRINIIRRELKCKRDAEIMRLLYDCKLIHAFRPR